MDMQDLITKYNEGNISSDELKKLEDLVASGHINLEALEITADIYKVLQKAESITPSPTMDVNFHKMLEGIKKSKSPAKLKFKIPWQLAFGLTACLLAFWLGRQQVIPKSIDQVIQPDLATSLINTEAVTDRIHLVSQTEINDTTDSKIIKALLFVINNDESSNVRLAGISALADYSYLPVVREGLINALGNQDSPTVISRIAEAIQASGEKMTSEEFSNRLNANIPEPLLSNIRKDLFVL